MNRILCLITLLALAGSSVRADVAAAGRNVLAAHQDAVVTVKLVLNQSMSFGGRDQQNESTTETIGTVIDPSGLTVISLSTIDPAATLRSLLAKQMRGQAGDIKIDSQVKDAKLVLADGTELTAQVVLRDKDLDLAYLRPVDKPAKPLAAISLAGAATPQVLDEVICLNRLGKVANRVVAVSIERIDAVVDRPRTFYIIGQGGSSGIGSPVFAASGAPVGVILMRNVTTEGEGNITSMFSGASALGIMPIIVPAADILEDAKQALETPKPSTR
jgi:hypothetical protein